MKPNDPSRRQWLQYLGAMPLLPLGGMVLTPALAAPSDGAPAAAVKKLQFRGMSAPDLRHPVDMATMKVGSALEVEWENGTRQTLPLSYQSFFRTGDWVPDGRGGQVLAGGYYDIHHRPIMDRTVPGQERPFFSDSPDGTSLLQVPHARVPGVAGHTVFAVVQFEYTTRAQDGITPMYGCLPSPIAVLTLDQHPETGALQLVKYHAVDTAAVHGLWITCGASLSPWGTHLSSEEYEPDAFKAATDPMFKAFSKNLYGDETRANPYHYGHLPEVTVHPDGTGTVRKHYCLGRLSHELVQVMPDQRTVLMGDDATNSGYFVFVADREKDLSAGTLYVARVGEGLSLDPQAPAVPLRWIRLGSATSEEVLQWADRFQPTDIMEVRGSDPGQADFHRILVNGKAEWVRILPGMHRVAAFLETHRYAAWMGASMAFTKMEGTTVNVRDKVAYSALQNCIASMVKGHPAHGPSMGVELPHALNAGAVMALNLRGGQRDVTGKAIDSEWMPADLRTLLTGRDIASDALGNTADPERIANPDNLKFSEQMRTLFIGEDSSQHVNNFLWAYQVDTGELSRILSVPSGGESTGLHAVDSLNGWTYIMSNFQHAGDWLPIHARLKSTLDPLIDAQYRRKYSASVGYLTLQPDSARKG